MIKKEFEQLIEINLKNARKEDESILKKSSNEGHQIRQEKFLEIKYLGSDYSLMVKGETLSDFKTSFEKMYHDEFGFITEERDLLVEAIRVRTVFSSAKSNSESEEDQNEALANKDPYLVNAYFEIDGKLTLIRAPIWKIEDLKPASQIEGPCIILIGTGTIVIEPDFSAFLDLNRNVFLKFTPNLCETKSNHFIWSNNKRKFGNRGTK